jgi:hypothetical protein
MTETEIAAFLMQRWQMGHAVKAIRMQLACLGVTLTDERILAGIKAYTSCRSENARLGKSARGK